MNTIKTCVLLSLIIILIACGSFGVLSNQANAEHDKQLYGAIADKSYPGPIIGKGYVGHTVFTANSGHKYPAEMFVNFQSLERYIAIYDQSGQEVIVVKQLINRKWENIWLIERLRKENRSKDGQQD